MAENENINDKNIIFFVHPCTRTIVINETENFLSNILLSCIDSNITGYPVLMNRPFNLKFKFYLLDINETFLNLFSQHVEEIKNGSLTKLYYNYFSKIKDSKGLIIYTSNSFELLYDTQQSYYLELFNFLYTNLEKHADFSVAFNESIKQANSIVEPISSILVNYNMINSNEKEKIGNPNKKERICRFCGRSIETGAKFNDKAHIIPEAFGNKNFICHEECDECNHYFGNKIEPHLIHLYDIQRFFFNANAKNGALSLKSSNDVIITNSTKLKMSKKLKYHKLPDNINIIIHKSPSSFDPNNPSIPFERNKVIFQNVYKSIIKMALNFIPKQYLEYFEETKKWLLNENSTCELPKIFLINKVPQDHASIALFIRVTENNNLPFLLVLFSYGIKAFLVIAPYCSKDTKTFLNNDDLKIIEKDFHFFLQNNYELVDFSSIEPEILRTNLNFKQKEG